MGIVLMSLLFDLNRHLMTRFQDLFFKFGYPKNNTSVPNELKSTMSPV